MNPSTRTPEGQPHHCPVCGKTVVIEPSQPSGDAPCPHCGCLLWFPTAAADQVAQGFLRFSIQDRSIPTKAQAIAAVIDRLVEVGLLGANDRNGILEAILIREALGSTGVGRGLAIPHAKYRGVATSIGAIADLPTGVDFDSLDGQPVNRICLLVSSVDQPGDHLRLLETVAHELRSAKESP